MGGEGQVEGVGTVEIIILKLPNPLTAPSPLRGEGDHDRCLRHFLVDIGLCVGYCTTLAP